VRAGDGAGKVYRYATATMSYYIDYAGPVSGVTIDASPLSQILLRDNAAVPPPMGPAVDGLTFAHLAFDPNDGGFYTFFNFIMRGPVLDIFDGPGLPAVADPRLQTLELRGLDICRTRDQAAGDCRLGQLQGSIDSVSSVAVGEPGSLMLLRFGLLGLGASRHRRRRN
jgi:hypothetical protein